VTGIAHGVIGAYSSGDGISSPIADVFAIAAVGNPATAFSGIRFTDDGRIQKREGGTGSVFVDTSNWYLPTSPGIGASYWVKLHKESGITPTGAALDTPISISTAPEWTISNNQLASKQGFFTAYIYADAGGTLLVSQSSVGGIHLYAEST
jgi:hypothetical protein